MTNLIKAESYRIRHSNKLSLLLILLCCALGVFLSFSSSFFDINRISLSQDVSLGLFIAVAGTIAPIGLHFDNRTAYYEIMDGKSPHAIILSRFVIYIPIATVFFFAPICIILMIFDGGTESVKLLLLLFVILLRLLVFAICCCLILKSTGGMMLMLPRVMLETIPMMLSNGMQSNEAIDPSKFNSLLNWLPTFQCYSLGGNIDSWLIAQIIIGFIVEAAIMYTLAYISYRKKWSIHK